MLTTEGAVRQIGAWGGWFGTPLVLLPTALIPAEHRASYPILPDASDLPRLESWRVIDGRVRLEAMRRCACSTRPPRTLASDARIAARLLLFTGHPERAVQILPKVDYEVVSLVTFLRISREEACELIATHKRMRRKVRGKAKPAPRRALDVVDRLRILRDRAEEDGFAIELVHLDECLGDWRV